MLKPTTESESSPEKVAAKLFVKESFAMKVKETIPDLQDALAYGKTADYRQDMKERAANEGKHSEVVRYHEGRRSPYVGIDKVFLGEAFRCAVLNLKRLFKLAERQISPAWG